MRRKRFIQKRFVSKEFLGQKSGMRMGGGSSDTREKKDTKCHLYYNFYKMRKILHREVKSLVSYKKKSL